MPRYRIQICTQGDIWNHWDVTPGIDLVTLWNKFRDAYFLWVLPPKLFLWYFGWLLILSGGRFTYSIVRTWGSIELHWLFVPFGMQMLPKPAWWIDNGSSFIVVSWSISPNRSLRIDILKWNYSFMLDYTRQVLLFFKGLSSQISTAENARTIPMR